MYTAQRYSDAATYIHSLLRTNPHNPEAWMSLGFAYAHQPDDDNDHSRMLRKAEYAYRNARRLEPESPQAAFGVGRVYWYRAQNMSDRKHRRDYLRQSLSAMEFAYEESGHDESILAFMINVKMDLGQVTEARKDLKLIEDNGESLFAAYVNAALGFKRAGNLNEASQYATKALRIGEQKEGAFAGKSGKDQKSELTKLADADND